MEILDVDHSHHHINIYPQAVLSIIDLSKPLGSDELKSVDKHRLSFSCSPQTANPCYPLQVAVRDFFSDREYRDLLGMQI